MRVSYLCDYAIFFFFTNALLKLAGGRGTGCGQPGISSIALVQ